MNQINEIINIEEITKSCRDLNPTELLQLLKADLMAFWSWGADGFTVDNKKRTRMFRMTVRGHHHKGYVFIFVNGLDLFDVYLTKKDGTITDHTKGEGLYFDMLFDWIDRKVERIDEYVR